MMKRKPVHPGRFLREEFLEPHGITQSAFAEALQLNRVTISKILNERQKITPDVAIRLSKCLKTTPDVWINMQTKLDLWEEMHRKSNLFKIRDLSFASTLPQTPDSQHFSNCLSLKELTLIIKCSPDNYMLARQRRKINEEILNVGAI